LRRAHLGSLPTGFVIFIESSTKGELDFNGTHSTDAATVSRLRQLFATLVCSSLSWPMGGGEGNAPLISASTTFPLRSYLSRVTSAKPRALLTPKFMARAGTLPPAVVWKTTVARHTLVARGLKRQKP
jgi:hypothetical protein